MTGPPDTRRVPGLAPRDSSTSTLPSASSEPQDTTTLAAEEATSLGLIGDGPAIASYGSSTVKRVRRTQAELEGLEDAIVAAVAADAPVSLRGVYYRVVSAGAVEKTEVGYRAVGRRLLALRRDGRVDYSDITDGTRWITAPTTYDSVDEMLTTVAATYRRSLWSRSAELVQVFSEKDAISGVLLPVTNGWDVPLGILRGYTSESFAWTVADGLDRRRRTHLVQFGDHDPSGVGAWEDFASKVEGFAPDAEVSFTRLAVTPGQIDQYDLPTRPTKGSDTRSGRWSGGGSVDVDAIPAPILRSILDEYLATFHDEVELDQLLLVERAERDSVRELGRWLR
ncbi:hypothetical protein BH23ACT2_BH23ACT2_29960 [soil metagenome]